VFLLLVVIVMRLNSDGQRFHQCQQKLKCFSPRDIYILIDHGWIYSTCWCDYV